MAIELVLETDLGQEYAHPLQLLISTEIFYMGNKTQIQATFTDIRFFL